MPNLGYFYGNAVTRQKFHLTTVHIEGRPLPIEAHVNPRAKKLKLRFQRDYNGLIVTLPHRSLQKQALQFVETCHSWIHKNTPPLEKLVFMEPGKVIPILGESTELCHRSHARNSVWEERGKMTVHCPRDQFEAVLKEYLKRKLQVVITERVKTHCETLNVNYNTIYIRNSRSNWGCCSHKKNLSFSWRLILTPLEVINYVAAHEVAHLVEMNHSPTFWKLVSHLCSSYESSRQWLRERGKNILS